MPPRLLATLVLKLNDSATGGPLTLAVPRITVFVGPNNAGKSLVLREVLGKLDAGSRGGAEKVVGSLSFTNDALAGADDEFIRLGATVAHGILVCPSTSYDATRTESVQLLVDSPMREELQPPVGPLGRLHLMFIAEAGGAALVESQRRGNLRQPPANTLDRLFREPARLEPIQREVHAAFGLLPVLDYTDGGDLALRFAPAAPPPGVVRKELSAEATAYFDTCRPAGEVSHGTRAFTGTLMALHGTDKRILLLDEPDAYLHPALARRLGQILGEVAAEREAQVFVATHSAELLMGCLEATPDVAIVRLGPWGEPAASLLNADHVRSLMRSAHLRSTGVLNGLFAKQVVVVEGESDRAFYAEIHRRMSAADLHPDASPLWISAGSWHAIPAILGALRRMGVPAAAILDFDTLVHDSGKLTDLLDAGGVDKATAEGLGQTRGRLFPKERRGELKSRGLSALEGEAREGARNLLDTMARNGLFVVPGGEVESWIPGVDATKQTWLGAALDRLDSAPDVEIPGEQGARDFLRRVLDWAHHDAKGMKRWLRG